MYKPTEKVALQIRSWQVDANIFKVMRYSLLCDSVLSGFFVLCCIVDYNEN